MHHVNVVVPEEQMFTSIMPHSNFKRFRGCWTTSFPILIVVIVVVKDCGDDRTIDGSSGGLINVEILFESLYHTYPDSFVSDFANIKLRILFIPDCARNSR